MNFRPGTPVFEFRIATRSGVLLYAVDADFLSTVRRAVAAKRKWQLLLPASTLRVHLLYPNGKRVPRADIKAALKAIQGER
ncbi:hypothetical protein HEAR1521 [Herminiimonas arsenicoxydans]|uniref:Uncharacterized protein n=1 Tax=Herminiimonas arsenicoxydans TaxID=204773 RepID=A4G5A1_HERAR|nr:hypothetical protein HEAR1521 [Herminiimonas arsenicoxydans]